MDPLTISMGLATLVPDILKWFGKDNDAATAQKIVTLAQEVTGTASGNEALQAVQGNPMMALQLQQEIDRNKEELARISQAVILAEIKATADNAAAVNATMQAEAAAEHWPTYSWRPFIGFVFGLYIASLFLLPLFGKQPVMLSTDMTLAIGGILGVASFFRGKAQADPRIAIDNRG